MKKLSIPQLLLVTTTTTGCSLLDVFKSEAAIAEDLCTQRVMCDEVFDITDLTVEGHWEDEDEMEEYIEDCAVFLEDDFEDLYEDYPDCKDKIRAELLCVANMNCDDYEDGEKCEVKQEEANDCIYD